MRPGPLRFKTTPREHQRREFFQSRNLKVRARIWACRSGKSKITIDESAFQYHLEEITGVLIFAPNIVHQNWVLKEYPTHCSVPFEGMIWTTSKASRGQKKFMADFQRMCLGRDNLKVLAVNSEALHSKVTRKFIKTFLKHHKGKVFWIVDEFHDFGGPGSSRTGAAYAVRDQTAFRRILSATPIDNTPMAAYSEYNLLEKGALGFTTHDEFKDYFGVWKTLKTKGGRSFPKFAGPRNEEELTERMAKFTSIVTREDAGLKEPLDVQKHFQLTDAQLNAYLGLKKNPMMGDRVLDGGALMLKLQQITSGFLYDENRVLHQIVKPEDNPRLLLTFNETVYSAPGKVIIWCRFTYEIERLLEMFKDAGVNMLPLYGKVSQKEKFENVLQLENDPGVKGIVGQWQAGIGLDMRAADTIIACSHTFNAIHRHQAGDRATAVGKQAVDLIDIIAHNTNDDYIMESLADKQDVSDRISTIGIKELLQRIGNG